jgi:hypothetical protein
MSTLMQASNQWASRPADQRFTSLLELDSAVQEYRRNSAAKVLSSRALTLQPAAGTVNGLQAVGPNGVPVDVTNWAFGQVCQRAGAPAGYLRSLPAPMAADCVNFGLKVERDISDLGILLHRREDGGAELAACTGPSYGRIWNASITRALVSRFGDGRTGHFRVPGEFGKQVEITKDNTTLYASDRDMFVFLADEEHRIEIPNRRNGEAGSLARGFFVWNSEVGSATFGIAAFLFDYVCANRIVWGAEEYKELRIRHTAGAPDRWIEEVAPALEAYAASSTASITKAIADARSCKVEKIEDFLAKRFTRSQANAIVAAHQADEQRPMESLWDVATGVTAYARGLSYQDERVALERKAGEIIDLAA